MENLDGENRFVDGTSQRKSDPLVPHGFGVAVVVGAGRETVVGVEV